jgi:hypothetical protein
MDDGFYTMTYVGAIGMGLGTLLFEDGTMRGFDMRGGIYDGSYVRNADGTVDISAELLVQPGMEIVTGMAPPKTTVLVPLRARLPAAVDEGTLIAIQVGDREAQASFKFMRGP